MQESTLPIAQTTPDMDSYTVQKQTSWCANRNHKQCAQECVGQHHEASRRAASTQACPCDSGRLVMQLHEAQHRYGELRANKTPGTALAACTLAMVAEIRTTREKEKMWRSVLSALVTIIADTCHTHRRLGGDDVPVLHVEPICTRLRQLRVVVQELEQDDVEVVTPRPETQHCGHEQRHKRKFGQKGRLNVPVIFKKYPAREFFPSRF